MNYPKNKSRQNRRCRKYSFSIRERKIQNKYRRFDQLIRRIGYDNRFHFGIGTLKKPCGLQGFLICIRLLLHRPRDESFCTLGGGQVCTLTVCVAAQFGSARFVQFLSSPPAALRCVCSCRPDCYSRSKFARFRKQICDDDKFGIYRIFYAASITRTHTESRLYRRFCVRM